MAWFHGRLYVGTGRNQLCVEAATLDFFKGNVYKSHPDGFPEVNCPADRYDLDLRAEIWQYTPLTHQWRRVYQSPADIPNPRAPGKLVARDIGYRAMVVHRDANGREALYVAGVTADEYIPELAASHPPRILRTTDGKTFTALQGAPGIIHTDAFGPQRPITYRSLITYKGQLLVTASGGLTGDGVILQVRDPDSATPTFSQVSPTDMDVFELAVFNGFLYAGTGDARLGYSVWKTSEVGAPSIFTQVVKDGAGRGRAITSVVSMSEYKGALYVGSSGWAFVFPNSELIRVNPDDTWDLVVGNARFTAAGVFKYPISGLPDGFGNLFNAHFWRQQEHEGALYVGTNDWSWAFRNWPVLGPLLQPEFGFDLYGTCDGQYWWRVTRDAFGQGRFNFGLRTMVSTGSALYMGSTNHVQGTYVWQSTDPSPCGKARSGATAPSGATAASPRPVLSAALVGPQRLVTDVQQCGTVLSWDPSPDAVRYRVLRAEHRVVTGVPFPVPPPNRSASVPDVPLLMPSGGPAREGDISVPGAMTTIGTTTATFFIDREAKPGAQYTYEVVAESREGLASAQSGFAVVPSARPAATFADARAAIGANLPQPEWLSLLADAERRAGQGDAAGSAQVLERLRIGLGLVARAEPPTVVPAGGLAPPDARQFNPAAVNKIDDVVLRLQRQLEHAGAACQP
jgi:hypothetical protein